MQEDCTSNGCNHRIKSRITKTQMSIRRSTSCVITGSRLTGEVKTVTIIKKETSRKFLFRVCDQLLSTEGVRLVTTLRILDAVLPLVETNKRRQRTGRTEEPQALLTAQNPFGNLRSRRSTTGKHSHHG